MSDEQVSATGNTTSETPSAGGQASGQEPDAKALLAKIESLEKELDKTRKENGKRRVKTKETAQRAAKVAAEQRKYRSAYKKTAKAFGSLLAEHKAMKAELAQLKPKAERYTSWEAKQLETIQSREASIPDGPFKSLLAKASTVDEKLDVLAAYDESVRAAEGRKPEEKPPAGVPPAGSQKPVSLADKNRRGSHTTFSSRVRASVNAVRARE